MTLHGIAIDPFTVAYLTAALWTNEPEAYVVSGPYHTKAAFGLEQINADGIRKAVADCQCFQLVNAADLRGVQTGYDRDGNSWTGAEQAGHDFWLDRCGHGVGFRDRKDTYSSKAATERLSAAAQAYGEVYVQWDEDENHPDYGEGGGAPLIDGGYIYIS